MPDILIRIFLSLGLLTLIIVWVTTSNYSLKNWLQNFPTARGFVTAFFKILLFLQVVNTICFPLPLISSIIISFIGIIIFMIGILLAVWAKFTMQGNWGVPAQHNIFIQKKLVTYGPFSRTRNPIYFGLILAFIGFELSIGSVLIVLVVPLFLLIFRSVLVEERLLEKHFGGKYLEYRKKVPRFF